MWREVEKVIVVGGSLVWRLRELAPLRVVCRPPGSAVE